MQEESKNIAATSPLPQSSFLPPVVLFNFNRPDLTSINLERILSINPTKLYLVCDGPRDGNELDKEKVKQVREFLQRVPESMEVVRFYSETNLGLKARFNSALDLVFASEPHAIILEDDCLVEPDFFHFASKALDVYRSDWRVGAVSAHRPVAGLGFSKVYFDEYLRIWGWATWADRWKAYRSANTTALSNLLFRENVLKKIRSRTNRFMARQIFTPEVESSTWDVPYSAYFLHMGLLSVSPPRNMVKNLGLESGTNLQDWSYLELPTTKGLSFGTNFPSPQRRSSLAVFREDVVRTSRWITAVIRRPRQAFRKFKGLMRN